MGGLKVRSIGQAVRVFVILCDILLFRGKYTKDLWILFRFAGISVSSTKFILYSHYVSAGFLVKPSSGGVGFVKSCASGSALVGLRHRKLWGVLAPWLRSPIPNFMELC